MKTSAEQHPHPLDQVAVDHFREYLRIPSVQPDVTYDEEIGGKQGMKVFVHTAEFKALNIGFALDEGLAHPDNIFQIVYGERAIWCLYVYFHMVVHSYYMQLTRPTSVATPTLVLTVAMKTSAEQHPHPLDQVAVDHFREYLRIPSVQPDVNYDECVSFFKRQAAELDLPMQVIELVPGKPIVAITWSGEDPSQPSIMLNSHMDVVPVYPEYWKYPPFSAERDGNGDIYARGAQDTKAAGIQYLEAVRRLKEAGVRLKRTVHITYMPDEEIGGKQGMKVFVHTPEFKTLNIGFALDEGLAHPDNIFQIVYGERAIWYAIFHCKGTGGPPELPFGNSAAEKVRKIVDLAMDYRQTQVDILESNPELTVGDVTTVNMTMLKGGDGASGETPDQFDVTFDIRVAVTQDHEALSATLQSWCDVAGPGVTYTASKMKRTEPTKLDNTNPWWLAFKSQCDKLGMTIQPVICPAAGDCRYLRLIGVPTLGFAPMCNTVVRMHDHNEYLNESVFLRGISIYCHLIPAVANLTI